MDRTEDSEPADRRGKTSSLPELTLLRQRLLGDEERLARALRDCPEGILFTDREGRITHANMAAERLLGTAGRSLESSHYTDAFWRITAVNGIASPEQGPALLMRVQSAGPIAGEEFTLERADGTRITLSMDAQPVFHDPDRLAGSVIRVTEIAGVERTEHPAPSRGADPIRGIVGSIANDFNNILTAIIGNISLARTEVNHEDEIYRTLTYVEKASMRARDLAERLLALAGPAGAEVPAQGAKAGFPEGQAIRGTGRILVMDDEEMVRHVAKRILTHLGYEVVVAEQGGQAVALYREAQVNGEPFRAVILDLTSSGGMGGREALAELIRIDPDVRAIVSTGFSTDPIMREFRQHGFKGAVRKPYEIVQLSSAVHQVLGE